MRAIMARLRGPRLSPIAEVMAGIPASDHPDCVPAESVAVMVETSYERARADLLAEAMKVCTALGLDLPGPLDAGDLVRFVYAQGWLACEKRLAAPNMADLIDLALNTTHAVTEQRASESLNQWTVRAVQQVVAYGVKSEPH